MDKIIEESYKKIKKYFWSSHKRKQISSMTDKNTHLNIWVPPGRYISRKSKKEKIEEPQELGNIRKGIGE